MAHISLYSFCAEEKGRTNTVEMAPVLLSLPPFNLYDKASCNKWRRASDIAGLLTSYLEFPTNTKSYTRADNHTPTTLRHHERAPLCMPSKHSGGRGLRTKSEVEYILIYMLCVRSYNVTRIMHSNYVLSATDCANGCHMIRVAPPTGTVSCDTTVVGRAKRVR